MEKIVADPRMFLKKIGMHFDRNPAQLDHKLLNSLPTETREELHNTWAMIRMNIADTSDLYRYPSNLKQAALLFSHDAERYRASLSWFARVATELRPTSVFEVGCGAGFTSAYLKHLFPSVSVGAIEAHKNLAVIASELISGEVVAGNYLSAAPTQRVDLVICDFGFDKTTLSPSTAPHSCEQFEQFRYCPSCVEDLAQQLTEYFHAWRGWLRPGGHLALTGRLAGFGEVLAAGRAAARNNLSNLIGLSQILRVHTSSGIELFPALVFHDSEGAKFSHQDAANIYAK